MKIISYKNLQCIEELSAICGKPFTLQPIAFQEGTFPYLGLLNFLMEIKVRDVDGSLGLNESRALLVDWPQLLLPGKIGEVGCWVWGEVSERSCKVCYHRMLVPRSEGNWYPQPCSAPSLSAPQPDLPHPHLVSLLRPPAVDRNPCSGLGDVGCEWVQPERRGLPEVLYERSGIVCPG